MFKFKLLEQKEYNSIEYVNTDREVLGLQGCLYVQWKIGKRISTLCSLGISDKAVISHLILVQMEHYRNIQMLPGVREGPAMFQHFQKWVTCCSI